MDEATQGRCLECDAPLQRKARGPAPKYCSANCRARAKYKRSKVDGRYERDRATSAAKRRAEREANADPCPYCGESMTNRRRVQCGKPECKRLWTNERNRKWQQRYRVEAGRSYRFNFTYEHICGICGVTWKSSESKQQFCSTSCANKARRWTRTCITCERPWEALAPSARYCSPACRPDARIVSTELALRVQIPWWAGRRWPTPPTRVRRRWYAGRCQRCDIPFVTDQPANRYCTPACARSDSRARRRARKRGAYVSDVYRAKVFERDKWTCRLCNRRAARDKVVPHPMAPVLDHIIPLANGGTHEPANVQCAHFLCNSLKGDRGGGEQLMLIG